MRETTVHNLLTGKTASTEFPESNHNSIVEDQWTAEAYLSAMRRNLYAASKPGADTATLLLAANTLALAAGAAWPGPATPPTDSGPSESRVRFNPGRDHDSL